MHSVPTSKLGLVAASAVFGALFALAAQHAFGASSSGSSTRATSPPVATIPGATTHIVLFQYTPSTSFAERSEIATAFIALREACVHPASHASSGRPYILSIDGGVNDSPEDRKWDHAFILTFANSSDRDYYISTDPAHMAFKASLGGRVTTAAVADFGAGEFTALAAKAGAKKGRRPSDEGIHVRRI